MATMLDQIVQNDLLPDGVYGGGYAQEWAEYKQALDRVTAIDPEKLALKYGSAMNDLDEAVVALTNSAWHAGAAIGDAFARAEQSFVYELAICSMCHGHGRARKDARAQGRAGNTECANCRGLGTVRAE